MHAFFIFVMYVYIYIYMYNVYIDIVYIYVYHPTSRDIITNSVSPNGSNTDIYYPLETKLSDMHVH